MKYGHGHDLKQGKGSHLKSSNVVEKCGEMTWSLHSLSLAVYCISNVHFEEG